jgi:glycosyltransferase involved in cell wall biosynthesis
MLCNVPWIGSSGFPFADVASYGHVVCQETPEAWAEMLIDAHDNYAEWTALAERAYVQALGYTMERNIGQYAQTIAKIIQRRRAAMGGRLPGVTTV